MSEPIKISDLISEFRYWEQALMNDPQMRLDIFDRLKELDTIETKGELE